MIYVLIVKLIYLKINKQKRNFKNIKEKNEAFERLTNNLKTFNQTLETAIQTCNNNLKILKTINKTFDSEQIYNEILSKDRNLKMRLLKQIKTVPNFLLSRKTQLNNLKHVYECYLEETNNLIEETENKNINKNIKIKIDKLLNETKTDIQNSIENVKNEIERKYYPCSIM